MDNPSTESTGPLDLNQAADAFLNILEKDDAPPEEPLVEGEAEPVEEPTEEPANEEEPPAEGDNITVVIDGKTVELTPQQVAEAYKSGLRQSDYTKKTMEVAEERKAVMAEREQAVQQRNAYAQRLAEADNQLSVTLEQQSQINWQELIDNDPVEYLKQQHLFNQRQAQLGQVRSERDQINQIQEQENSQAYVAYIQEQQQELLAKLPSWKDAAKAKEERGAIKEYLKGYGFTDDDIGKVVDHRHVLLVRNAMQFDKLLKQAPDATKRVGKAPVRVERPGAGENDSSNDARKTAMKQLRKSGSVEDAARVFAQLI